MKEKVQIILVQNTRTDRDNGKKTHSYRIAKLIGAVTVYIGSAEVHVGDFLDPNQAERLTSCSAYKVTVTEKGGKE
jgi:hypothetical protein